MHRSCHRSSAQSFITSCRLEGPVRPTNIPDSGPVTIGWDRPGSLPFFTFFICEAGGVDLKGAADTDRLVSINTNSIQPAESPDTSNACGQGCEIERAQTHLLLTRLLSGNVLSGKRREKAEKNNGDR